MAERDVEFTLVAGDPLYRAQQAIGLIPRRGMGLPRRIAIAIGLTWLPLAVFAAWHRLLLPGVAPEPLLQHFGIHARFLLALPLMLVAEALADRVLHRVVPQFVASGVVDDATRPAFVAVLRDARRLRDSRLALAAIAALVGAVVLVGGGNAAEDHELLWAHATSDAPRGFDFAAFWLLYVARPIFLLVLSAWLWRLFIVTRMFWQIARLPLRLAPTHPDRAGGLGFVEAVPGAFAPFLLAVSVVISATWAHDALYHAAPVLDLKIPAAVLVAAGVLVGLAPLAAFTGLLVAVKRRSLMRVGALLGEHGRLFQRRWLDREVVEDDALLGAPEIGPVADTVALYEAVARMRPFPAGRAAIVPLALATALPLVPVFATQMPLGEIVGKLLGPLVGL